MSGDPEADRIAARIRAMQLEYLHSREPLSAADIDGAIVYALRVGAPSWLVALLEHHRPSGTTPPAEEP